MGGLIHEHNTDIEAGFLGTILFDPAILDEPYAALPDEAFYSEKHRRVWKFMRQEHAQHGTFDSVTLCARAGKQHVDDVTSWLHTVYGLLDRDPTYCSGLAYPYAQKLKEFYARRERAKAARKYEADIERGVDPAYAKQEFEVVASALDEVINPDHGTSDEQIADAMGEGGRYPSGYADLDRQTGGFASPGFIVLAARPSVGKSAFARGVIRSAAKRGERVFWYSQDQAANQIMELEVSRLLRKSRKQIEQLTRDERLDAIRQVRQDVWRDSVELIDRPLPLDQIVSLARISSPDLVVVDYLQIISAGRSEEYDDITTVSKAMKTLAFQLRVPVLGLAQFNRSLKTGGTPKMEHLHGSSQLEKDAEQIFALERDTESAGEMEATLHILKNKVGPTGRTSLMWIPKWATYENAYWKEGPA